ncbi:MAG: D-alanine--D-alanine ligase [bacterium]
MDVRKKRIGVLMGGLSGEREVSLRSGAGVFEALKRLGCDAVAIDAGRDVVERLREEKVEAAFIALHGPFGEDGTIQGLLEVLGIPYTGSGVLASALAMDKIFSKKVFAAQGIPTPPAVFMDGGGSPESRLTAILENVGVPLMLKPAAEGSSIGVELVKDEEALPAALARVASKYPRCFAEKYVCGKSLTVGIVGVGAATRALPVLELVPRKDFYDYEAKYTAGMTEFHCPARIGAETTRRVQETALMAHAALGCHGVSRVDVMLSGDGAPYVLEVNTIPGMTTLSDLPAEAEAEGMTYDELVEEILLSATLDRR